MKLESPKEGRILTLNDFTTKEIKGFIQKYNNTLKIKGYSKIYKKADMIELIKKHPLVEVVGNINSVRFNVGGAQVKGMDMIYNFKPKKVIKKMIKLRKPSTPPKKEKVPKNAKEVNELIAKATTKEELLEIKKKFGTKEKVPPKKETDPPKKEKVLPKLNKFKKQLRDSKTIEELTKIFSSSQYNTDKNSISFKQEQQLQKIYETKLKELKNPKKPRTKAQKEATKKLVESNKAKKEKSPKKEKSLVDIIVDMKLVMSPIFNKKFNPKSIVDTIKSMKDIDVINKEITIIQKKVKETSSKLKSSGKETEAERNQLQKLQEKYTKRLKSVIKSMKKGADSI